jgi:oligopeptide/dipeptide ABC transporter ATP-binding protein
MQPILEVIDLRVRFRSKGRIRALLEKDPDPYIDAVRGVSFSVRSGETLALVGESGAGKTTLARSIIGLTRPSEGTIRFMGQSVTGLNDAGFKNHRRHMAMMFQDPAGCLSPRMTVRSLITEPFKIHGITMENNRREAGRLLRLVGLQEDFMDRYPHQLSGGQARRVGIARALALSPSLIIADEPTAGLDVSVQGEVLNLLTRLQKELNIGFLIISHNLSVIRHISDRMAIMYLGRFIEEGETEHIFSKPGHPYTAALLSATPEPDPDARQHRMELKGEIPSLMKRPSGCEFHPRCPYVADLCRNDFPNTVTIESGRRVACHFPLDRFRDA